MHCVLQIIDLRGFHIVGKLETEDAGVEVEFGFQGALDVLGSAEAMSLAFEGHVGDGQALCAQGMDHQLCLIRWNDLVVKALKEDYRAGELIEVVDGRTLPVEVSPLRVGADETVQVV